MPKNYLLIYAEQLATEIELLCQNIKVDGSLFKIYCVDGRTIRVNCDWDIGAVFIDSEINLFAVFGDKKHEKR